MSWAILPFTQACRRPRGAARGYCAGHGVACPGRGIGVPPQILELSDSLYQVPDLPRKPDLPPPFRSPAYHRTLAYHDAHRHRRGTRPARRSGRRARCRGRRSPEYLSNARSAMQSAIAPSVPSPAPGHGGWVLCVATAGESGTEAGRIPDSPAWRGRLACLPGPQVGRRAGNPGLRAVEPGPAGPAASRW